jgi:hypothetical protein
MDIYVASSTGRLGPLTIGELTTAVQQKQVSLSDLAWRPGNTEWVPLRQMPDVLDAIIPPLPNASLPGTSQAPTPSNQLSPPPPVPCEHQTKLWNALHFRVAIAGLVLLLLAFGVLAAVSRSRERANAITCANSMKQLALSFKIWAIDHEGRFPFNVSMSQGGSMEVCSPGANGFDQNPVPHLLILSNELRSTLKLVCPEDSSKQRAVNWQLLQPPNVSYMIHVGTNVDERCPDAVLAVCPIHGHVVLCSGRVQFGPRFRILADDPSCRAYVTPNPTRILLHPTPTISNR